MDIGSSVTNTGPYIETVRSLHQTVTALRTALEESKKEVLSLKNKVWPIDSIEQSLTQLAIENHALRRKLLESNVESSPADTNDSSRIKINVGDSVVPPLESVRCKDNLNTNVEELISDTKVDDSNTDIVSTSLKEKVQSVGQADIASNQSEYDQFVINKRIGREDNDLAIPNSRITAKALNPSKSDITHVLPDQSELTELKTDSQKQSLTNICVNEEVQPNSVNTKLSNYKDIQEKSYSTEFLAVKEVHLTEKLQKTKFDPSVTDSKKAKKEKRASKKQLKVPVILGRKTARKHKIKASVHIKAKTFDDQKTSESLDSLTVVKTPSRVLKFSKTTNFFNLNSEISCKITKGFSNMSDNNDLNINNKFQTQQDEKSSNNVEDKCQNNSEQEPEVDDIELIFTTDDTKESDFKEQLVSIDSVERQNNTQGVKFLAPDQEQSIDISDRELDDDVFDTSFDQDNQDGNALQVFQLERDNSQLYNSKSDNSINQEDRSLRSYYSYQDSSFENKSMEKDESFDRFEERIRIVETDISKVGITEVDYAGIRRNTCPNPLQYRPLLHRSNLNREAINKGLNVKKSRPILAHSNAIRKESGAQTDISALPGSSWRSESSLANKAHLGDNFTTLPSKYPLPGSRLKLSEKRTVEARRVLLSDIGFTSMVPELSRSADHLCPSTLKPPVTTYSQFLRTPELYSPAYTSQRFTWTTTTATPSDGSHSHSRYSINPLTPPVQTRRCSAPVSPSRRGNLKNATSRVRFANGSLPELRGDWTQMTADSGDSTDSLVEEAENYLRRSIDCILGSSRGNESDSKRNVLRRASAPESASDNTPPQGWQPFLPRQPRDLKPDHWVKVITPEGKVKGGRVRYIGPVASQTDQFVGVQLAVPEGHSDGTFSTRRYFLCEPYHGIFVPFKKVIMGWRP